MKHSPHQKLFIHGLFLLFLAACSTTSARSTYVGVLSTGNVETSIATEQQTGYQLKRDALGFTIQWEETESTVQDELQKSVRKMVEGSNEANQNTKAIAIVGATSNEATARTAALVNFFNVPMLIPTADGDNLMPENNLWAFQLSAPGSAYARYLFGQLLNKNTINGFALDSQTLQDFKIAILYEQTTFGENAAVAAAQSAMRQMVEIKINDTESVYGMEIGVYGSFPEKTLDAERLNDLVEQVKTQGAQLVYLVANDPLIAQRLVQVFREQYEETDTPLPILVGQVGAFASQTFMESPEAADVVILRQVWNHDRCPEEITSYYAGQAYGAMYLLDNAIRVADESMPKQGFSLNQATEDTDRLTKFRENVRDALKQTRLDVPCVGMVSFDNTGKNKELHFELIKVKGNSERIISTDAFLELLKQRILLPPF